MLDSKVLQDLLRGSSPRIAAHFQKVGASFQRVSATWLMSAFAGHIPLEPLLRIWDVMFYEGDNSMLFRAALALLDINSEVRFHASTPASWHALLDLGPLIFGHIYQGRRGGRG